MPALTGAVSLAQVDDVPLAIPQHLDLDVPRALEEALDVYAAVPEGVRRAWGPMIEGYLEKSARLAGVVSLIDGRHDPTALDRRMVAWLAERGIPTLVVLTKADRVPRGRRRPRLEETAGTLGLDPEQVVWFSSRSGEGRDAVFSAVDALLRQEVP